MVMELTSHVFEDGGRIPEVYTCDGESRSVPLTWRHAPKDAQSFAVICDDPDAPGGTFSHWAIYNIPGDKHFLNESLPKDPLLEGIAQAVNDFGGHGYGPPCPPKDHGPHRYIFRVYALDVAKLDVSTESKVPDVEEAVQGHVIETARLTGIYER